MDKHYVALSAEELAHLMAAGLALTAVVREPIMLSAMRKRDPQLALTLAMALEVAGYLPLMDGIIEQHGDEPVSSTEAAELFDATCTRLADVVIHGMKQLRQSQAKGT